MSDLSAEIHQVGRWHWQIKLMRGFMYGLAYAHTERGAHRLARRWFAREQREDRRREETSKVITP